MTDDIVKQLKIKTQENLEKAILKYQDSLLTDNKWAIDKSYKDICKIYPPYLHNITICMILMKILLQTISRFFVMFCLTGSQDLPESNQDMAVVVNSRTTLLALFNTTILT